MGDTARPVTLAHPKWQDVETLVAVRNRFRVSIWVWLAVPILGAIGILSVPDPSPLMIALWVLQGVSMLLLMTAALEGGEVLGFNAAMVVILGLLLVFLPCGPVVLFISMGMRISARFVSWGFAGMHDERIQKFIDDERRGFRKEDVAPTRAREDSKPQAHVAAESSELPLSDYEDWISRLNEHLEASGLPTRSEHFRQEALAYGFINELAPSDFLKSGYNQSANPALIAGLVPRQVEVKTPVAPIAVDQPSSAAQLPPQSAIGTDAIEKLERLEALRKSGALTDEEFAAEKNRLLRRAE